MLSDQIHFVTGRLAEHSLHMQLGELAAQFDFGYTVDVLPISVAALMTPPWIAKRIQVPSAASRVVIPGYCKGDLSSIEDIVGRPVERGPRDLRQLPEWFGAPNVDRREYGNYDIEIIAEINHAPQLPMGQIIEEARQLKESGADVIDVGCEPGGGWKGVAECVQALRSEGHRVSIDSMDPEEIALAAQAGVELVLSVNSSNRHLAAEWGCEVVVIPDDPHTLRGLDDTIEMLRQACVPFRVDAILEPIGIGLAASIGRYLEVRRSHPNVQMMMGIGNVTELTDVDSAGLNLLLLGLCQELHVHSVLTTQVIHWARTSVRECDIARRLVYYATQHGMTPKHLDPRLITLRDTKIYGRTLEELERLAREIKDHDYRIYAAHEKIHLISAGIHLHDEDPFSLFDRLLDEGSKKLDPGHAFYLGYEMAKAVTALTLSKEYRQDEPLDWGYLTRRETSHRVRKR